MANKTSFDASLRVFSEFTRYRGPLVLVLILGLLVAAIQPLCVKLVERIVDQLQHGVPPDFFRKTPVFIVSLFAVSGISKYFYNTVRRYITEKVILLYREKLFRKYLNLSLTDIYQKTTGELLSRIQNDLVQISMGLETFCDILKEPFVFLGLLGVAFYCDWQLAVATLIVAPIVALLFSKSGAAVKRYSGRNLIHFSDIVSLSHENLVGAHIVKVFRLEKLLTDKFLKIQQEYFKTLWKSIKVQELATPAVEFVGAILMAFVLVFGGARIAAGELTSGQLIAFVIAIGLAQMPIKKLNNAYLKMKNAEAAAERVYAILDLPEFQSGRSGNIRKPNFVNEIEFRDAHLYYGEKAALNGLSLKVKKGQRVALVGTSGSGKTSLVNLLPRLFELSSGELLFDGVEVSKIYLDDLRQLISFVTQETFLFHDTIYENIRYGDPFASREAILRAATLAHCDTFIQKFPRGIDTVVGDRGICLSGGERQRVAIARAILKGAPILVLDEATSNLDSDSELVVQSALETLMEGKTTFIIAHRFSTIKNADQIFVLDRGKIVEGGTHAELSVQGREYSKLLKQQNFTTVGI